MNENSVINLVLVGNGLSIASNPRLSLSALTDKLVDNLKNDGEFGKKFLELLTTLSKRTPDEGTSIENFEELLGSIYYHYRAIEDIGDWWAEYLGLDEIKSKNFENATKLTYVLAQQGLRRVLEIIFEESAPENTNDNVVSDFLKEINKKNSFNLDFFNLNFDDILYRNLLNGYSKMLWDIADGRGPDSSINFPNWTVNGRPLRADNSDKPFEKTIGLYHLHGSFLYWDERKSKKALKLSRGDIRKKGILNPKVSGSNFRPLVLMGWQETKNTLAGTFPFNYAYSAFQLRLRDSKIWYIVGFSFRDERVVRYLQAEIIRRNSSKIPLTIRIFDNNLELANLGALSRKLDMREGDLENYFVRVEFIVKDLRELEFTDFN